ncbi:hypothetical protein ACXYTJ_00880 [Gilvimarinus sp. F26214L]|uniref:hypothetical protein n=1 Tax=Gilvimarinus sp. DZF01 TaxID=3461371 RepID=UPI0040454D87
MLAHDFQLKPGTALSSPAGRRLEVGDVFVPRNEAGKSRSLPSSFRHLGRKVVVFRDGSIAALAEVRRSFRVINHESH